MTGLPQTDRELAEALAKVRMPSGHAWAPLAREIEALLGRYRHVPRTNDGYLTVRDHAPAAASGPMRFSGPVRKDHDKPFRIGEEGSESFMARWNAGELAIGIGLIPSTPILTLTAVQSSMLARWLPGSEPVRRYKTTDPTVAPPGECEYCDRRRNVQKARMQRVRRGIARHKRELGENP